MQTQAYRLRGLRLKRVSLVDTPANEHARVVLFKSKDGPKHPSGKPLDLPPLDEIGRCSQCNGSLLKGDKFCRACGAKAPASKSAQSVPLDGSTRSLLLVASCRTAGETPAQAVDRAVRELGADVYAQHVAATHAGGEAEVEKSTSATEALNAALDRIVAKTGATRGAATDAFLRTETGRRLYALYRTESAVEVN